MNRGIQEQKNRGTEEQKNRRTEEQKNRRIVDYRDLDYGSKIYEIDGETMQLMAKHLT